MVLNVCTETIMTMRCSVVLKGYSAAVWRPHLVILGGWVQQAVVDDGCYSLQNCENQVRRNAGSHPLGSAHHTHTHTTYAFNPIIHKHVSTHTDTDTHTHTNTTFRKTHTQAQSCIITAWQNICIMCAFIHLFFDSKCLQKVAALNAVLQCHLVAMFADGHISHVKIHNISKVHGIVEAPLPAELLVLQLCKYMYVSTHVHFCHFGQKRWLNISNVSILMYT